MKQLYTKTMGYFFIGILVFLIIIVVVQVLGGIPLGNPNGEPSPDYPYFIAPEETFVKGMMIPKGSMLFYEAHLSKRGRQKNMLDESRLTTIQLPEGKTLDWGGMPVYKITKFFNPGMRGFTVHADFKKLGDGKKSKFLELWQVCDPGLEVNVMNTKNWSFNIQNIEDVQGCGVNYQRYFKEDREQQSFLDQLYSELIKGNRKS